MIYQANCISNLPPNVPPLPFSISAELELNPFEKSLCFEMVANDDMQEVLANRLKKSLIDRKQLPENVTHEQFTAGGVFQKILFDIYRSGLSNDPATSSLAKFVCGGILFSIPDLKNNLPLMTDYTVVSLDPSDLKRACTTAGINDVNVIDLFVKIRKSKRDKFNYLAKHIITLMHFPKTTPTKSSKGMQSPDEVKASIDTRLKSFKVFILYLNVIRT